MYSRMKITITASRERSGIRLICINCLGPGTAAAGRLFAFPEAAAFYHIVKMTYKRILAQADAFFRSVIESQPQNLQCGRGCSLCWPGQVTSHATAKNRPPGCGSHC